MRIWMPQGDYRVVLVLEEDARIFSCLAVRTEQGKECCYLLQEFREPITGKELFCHLAASRKDVNRGMDVFTKEGNVWAISRYYSGTPFMEQAERTDILEEKLLLWEGVLREIFFHDTPLYLQYEAAGPLNLVVDDSLTVHANLRLFEPEKFCDELFLDIQKRLFLSFSKLFAREIKDKSGAVAAYGKKLQEAGFVDGISVYQNFRKLKQKLEEQKSEGETERQTYLIRWWKKFFLHADSAVKYAYWLAVAALWGLFFGVCVRPAAAPAERNLIPAIGTVGIRGYELPEAEIVPESEDEAEDILKTENIPETETAGGTEAETEDVPETEAAGGGSAEMG